jgi:hypothetical protein
MDVPKFHYAKLCILFQKGVTKEINNYRGIYMLIGCSYVCSKIISALIGNRLQETLPLTEYDLLTSSNPFSMFKE